LKPSTWIYALTSALLIISLITISYPLYLFIQDAREGKFDVSINELKIVSGEDGVKLNFTLVGYNNARVTVKNVVVNFTYEYVTNNATYHENIEVHLGDLEPGASKELPLSIPIRGIPVSLKIRIQISMNIAGYLPFQMTFEKEII